MSLCAEPFVCCKALYYPILFYSLLQPDRARDFRENFAELPVIKLHAITLTLARRQRKKSVEYFAICETSRHILFSTEKLFGIGIIQKEPNPLYFYFGKIKKLFLYTMYLNVYSIIYNL